MMQTDGDTAYLQAGAGIVADSDPEREYLETGSKLAVLKEAVESAMEDAK
jgi:anthranilate synthase component 1